MSLRDNGLGRFRGYSLGSNPGDIGPEVCPTLGPEQLPKKEARRFRRAFDWQTVIPVYGSVTGGAHSVVMPARGAMMR